MELILLAIESVCGNGYSASENKSGRCCGLMGNAVEGLTLVAEEVLAGSRGVVFFVLAGEQGSQTFIDVFHISPRGFCDLHHLRY